MPLAAPIVPPAAWCEWAPPSKLYLPERLAQTGLDVVFKPNVEAVGARLGGYYDLYRLGLAATYYSLGIRL